MKRILFVTVLLSACAVKPYDCYKVLEPGKPSWDYSAICIPAGGNNPMTNQSMNNEEFLEFASVASKNFCWRDNNSRFEWWKDYYAFKYTGDKIGEFTEIYVCTNDVFDKYEDMKNKEQKQYEDNIRAEKQETEKMKKALAEYPNVRPQVRSIFKEACIATYEKDSVKAYATNVCECLTCVFDAMYGKEVAYSYIKSGGKSWDISAPVMMVMDGFGGRCADYYMNRASFDPCKWAKDNEKAKK